MSPPDPRRAAFFEWDSANEEHLAQHDASPYEVEQVFHKTRRGAATSAAVPRCTRWTAAPMPAGHCESS